MIFENVQALKERISRRDLFTLVSGVTQFHRIQASPGFEAAAHWCVQACQQRGIEARVISYPATAGGSVGGWRLFQQWSCKQGWCRMTWPREMDIADYELEPISIIQKSAPADWRDKSLCLVDMDRGCEEAAYADLDLTGKILLTHQHLNKFDWAIQKRGAVGIISDYLNEAPTCRCPEELLDTLNYTSYWWNHGKEEKQAFGFVVSPRVSKQLVEACKLARQEYEAGRAPQPWPQINAYVDSVLEDGESHIVEAILPGRSEQCVLLCAHLCHPCASANDNASGVSAGIEALAAIRRAVDRGLLPELEHSIRLILVPEFTGTYNYLADPGNRQRCIAGLNLDMVGAKQEDTTGAITATALPWATPSFVGDLTTLIMQEARARIETEEDQLLANVKTAVVPFGLGSDHFILSDPAVGIPSLMLGQWPDKYYHTSSDTIDRMDMNVLKYSTLVAAGFAYTLSNFTAADARLVWQHQRTRMMAEAERLCREAAVRGMPDYQLADRLAALRKFYILSAASVQQLADVDPADQVVWMELALPDGPAAFARGPVYRRKLDSPIENLADLLVDCPAQQKLLTDYQAKYQDVEDRDLLEVLCTYYMDGCRAETEVIACVQNESGQMCGRLLSDYMQLLVQCGMAEIVQEG